MKKGQYKKSIKGGIGSIRCHCCRLVGSGKNNSCKTNKVFMSKFTRRTFKLQGEEE